MKFPSIQTLAHATLATFKRFPLTILFVVIACYYSIRLSHDSYVYLGSENHYYYNNILWSAYLGMLLSLNVFLFAERKHLSNLIKWSVACITVVLVSLFYISLPNQFSAARLKQFILLIAGFHLLVAFIPFTKKGEVNGFWQYNKNLFLRALATGLYSLVLFIGLSLAMLAVEKLFPVHIKSEWYLDLWIIIFEGFSSIFFLSAFPSHFEKLESNKDYPKGLKIFTQYVLLPLITVYLVILYAYLIKIVITHQWPYGWVSYLVLAFAITGILSLLLIYPIRYEANNKWILTFSRFYYLAICPLIILLFLAIERRIKEYGITEDRYIVLGLACWLGFISLYFIFSRSKNIKAIPLSLSLIALFISFGPWGAVAVSFNSQNTRLKYFLAANGMLSPYQKIIPGKKAAHSGDVSQINSIIEYMVTDHGYNSLQPLFNQNLDSMLKDETGKRLNIYRQSEKLTSFMKVNSFDDDVSYEHYFRIHPDRPDSLISVSGYEYFLNDYEMDNNSDDSVMNIYDRSGHSLEVLFTKESGRLSLKAGSDNPVIFDVNALVKSLKKNDFTDAGDDNKFRQTKLIFAGENKDIAAKIIFQEIRGSGSTKKIVIYQLRADILIGFKTPSKM